ncbi:hypothetical protein FOL47_010299 [Perkinsus chesapeaki]|uniref:Uncharacterized protein n=1 Tax=Perkinsus chesapeaki TaxID=330153 RepID=A0A7J6MPU5_PERCH|nr:hypothetical protein FOL47_010299 [Perkinsus chesapeaki]
MSSEAGKSNTTTATSGSPSSEGKPSSGGETIRLSQVINDDKVLQIVCAFLPSVLVKLRRLSKIFYWRLTSERVGKILSKVSMELNLMTLDPFFVAAAGQADLLWLMIVTSDIDVKSCRDTEGGCLSTTMVLLERGCNVNAKGSSGYTPLHEACYLVNKPAICELLLSRGANVDAISRNGSTPLFVACREQGGAAIAATLLRYGAHPDDGGDKGWTPLFVAALTNQSDTVALLLSYGASINEVNPIDGRTPLHAAAEMAALDVVEILLRHGADLEARDVNGRTPVETAGIGLGPEILAQLRGGAEMAEEDIFQDEELVRLMMEHPRTKAVKETLEAAAAASNADSGVATRSTGDDRTGESFIKRKISDLMSMCPTSLVRAWENGNNEEAEKTDSRDNEAVLLSSYSATFSQRGGSLLTSLGGLDGIPEDSAAQASSSLISCIPAAVDFSSTGRFGLTSGDTDLLVVDDDTPSSLSGGGIFREPQQHAGPPPPPTSSRSGQTGVEVVGL